MNEEMPVGANRMRFCFFILHSAFIICVFEPLQTDVGKTDRRHRALTKRNWFSSFQCRYALLKLTNRQEFNYCDNRTIF
jgi:hypothetical protein